MSTVVVFGRQINQPDPLDLTVRTATPVRASGTGIVYAKLVAGKQELFYTDTDAGGEDVQITSGSGVAGGVAVLTDLTDVTAKTGSGTTVVMQGKPTVNNLQIGTDFTFGGTTFAAVQGSGTSVVSSDTPTILTPTIADFKNSGHDHSDAAGGGTISATSLSDVAAKTGSGTTVVFQGKPTINNLQIGSNFTLGGSTISATTGSGGTMVLQDAPTFNGHVLINSGNFGVGITPETKGHFSKTAGTVYIDATTGPNGDPLHLRNTAASNLANDVFQHFSLKNDNEDVETFASIQVTSTDLTDGAEYGEIDLRVVENGTINDVYKYSGGAHGMYVGAAQVLNMDANRFALTPQVATTGTPVGVLLTAAAHTGMTASTEVRSVDLDLSATKQWATGGISVQREMYISAPTYAFVGASTIAVAGTLTVEDAPQAGANCTITDSFALRVEAGESRFMGATVRGQLTGGADGVRGGGLLADFREDANAVKKFRISNQTNGTTARTQFVLFGSNTEMKWDLTPTSFTPTADFRANTGHLTMSSSENGNMLLGTRGTGYLCGVTNLTEAFRVDSSQNFLVNRTAQANSGVIEATGKIYASTILECGTDLTVGNDISFAGSTISATTGSASTVVLNDTPTILTPTIADFKNATHDHADAAGGGTLGLTNLSDVTAKAGTGTIVAMATSPALTTPSITGTASMTHAAGVGIEYAATTKAELTGDEDDYALGTGTVFRLSSDGNHDITGLTGGADGRIVTIINVGTNNVAFVNEDAGSAAANRIIVHSGIALTLGANDTVSFIYDSTKSRWIVLFQNT